MSKNNYRNYFLVSSMATALLIVYIMGKHYYPRKRKPAPAKIIAREKEKVIILKENVLDPKKEKPDKVKDVVEYPFNNVRTTHINIPARDFDTPYRQLGILKKIYGKHTILPLMGRPLYNKINKWQYYTTSENGEIQLPISKFGRSCSSKRGCYEIKTGQNVYVEGFHDVFRVQLIDD